MVSAAPIADAAVNFQPSMVVRGGDDTISRERNQFAIKSSYGNSGLPPMSLVPPRAGLPPWATLEGRKHPSRSDLVSPQRDQHRNAEKSWVTSGLDQTPVNSRNGLGSTTRHLAMTGSLERAVSSSSSPTTTSSPSIYTPNLIRSNAPTPASSVFNPNSNKSSHSNAFAVESPQLMNSTKTSFMPNSSSSSVMGTPECPLIPKRRRRTTPAELAVLEDEFKRNPLPSQRERSLLADRVGMTGRAIQVWFQNKRQKEKKDSLPAVPTSSNDSLLDGEEDDRELQLQSEDLSAGSAFSSSPVPSRVHRLSHMTSSLALKEPEKHGSASSSPPLLCSKASTTSSMSSLLPPSKALYKDIERAKESISLPEVASPSAITASSPACAAAQALLNSQHNRQQQQHQHLSREGGGVGGAGRLKERSMNVMDTLIAPNHHVNKGDVFVHRHYSENVIIAKKHIRKRPLGSHAPLARTAIASLSHNFQFPPSPPPPSQVLNAQIQQGGRFKVLRDNEPDSTKTHTALGLNSDSSSTGRVVPITSSSSLLTLLSTNADSTGRSVTVDLIDAEIGDKNAFIKITDSNASNTKELAKAENQDEEEEEEISHIKLLQHMQSDPASSPVQPLLTRRSMALATRRSPQQPGQMFSRKRRASLSSLDGMSGGKENTHSSREMNVMARLTESKFGGERRPPLSLSLSTSNLPTYSTRTTSPGLLSAPLLSAVSTSSSSASTQSQRLSRQKLVRAHSLGGGGGGGGGPGSSSAKIWRSCVSPSTLLSPGLSLSPWKVDGISEWSRAGGEDTCAMLALERKRARMGHDSNFLGGEQMSASPDVAYFPSELAAVMAASTNRNKVLNQKNHLKRKSKSITKVAGRKAANHDVKKGRTKVANNLSRRTSSSSSYAAILEDDNSQIYRDESFSSAASSSSSSVSSSLGDLSYSSTTTTATSITSQLDTPVTTPSTLQSSLFTKNQKNVESRAMMMLQQSKGGLIENDEERECAELLLGLGGFC